MMTAGTEDHTSNPFEGHEHADSLDSTIDDMNGSPVPEETAIPVQPDGNKSTLVLPEDLLPPIAFSNGAFKADIRTEVLPPKPTLSEPLVSEEATPSEVSEKTNATPAHNPNNNRMPSTVLILGISMFLMNCAFVMTFSFSGIYLKSLGASNALVGLLEGLSEAVSFVMKFVSGVVSDALRRRKRIMYIGYTVSLIGRFFMAAGTTMWPFLAGKWSERIGNGVQGTPRDAIVADVTPPHRIGAAYGLKRSLATLGSIVGAVCGVLAMHATDDNMRAVFWMACIPSVLAFLLLTFFVKEPKHMGHSAVSAEIPLPATKRRHRISWANLRLLGPAFWFLMLVNAIFMLARMGEQPLVLHAKTNYGMQDSFAPVIFMVFNAGWCLTSYPVGLLADRMNRYWFLAIGIILMVLADIILATAANLSVLFVGILFWGFQYGITMNIFSSLIAETVPENLRGTGFGCYYIINAIAVVVAETTAGHVADMFGFHAAFIVSAIIGLMSLICLIGILAFRSTARKNNS